MCFWAGRQTRSPVSSPDRIFPWTPKHAREGKINPSAQYNTANVFPLKQMHRNTQICMFILFSEKSSTLLFFILLLSFYSWNSIHLFYSFWDIGIPKHPLTSCEVRV